MPSAELNGVQIDSSTGTEADLQSSLAAEMAETVEQAPASTSTGGTAAAGPVVETGAPASESAADPDPASEAGKALAGRRKSMQDRIDQATWEKHEEKRRADRLQAELDAVKNPAAAQPAADGRPKFKSFVDKIGTDYDDYESAVEAYTDALTDSKLAARDQASVAAQQSRGYQDALHQTHTRGAEIHADFDAKIETMVQEGRRFTPFMTDAILSDPDTGHQLAYVLASEPETYQALFNAPTLPAASRILGRILTRFDAAPTGSASKEAPLSKAKPPVKPVAGQPKATSGPPGEDASDEEHRLYYNQQEKARRRA